MLEFIKKGKFYNLLKKTYQKSVRAYYKTKAGKKAIERKELEQYQELWKEKLEKLKNSHGGRCFVIGNGPSLKSEDLDKLKDEITFCSNFIYKIYDETDFRPTYYTLCDPHAFKKVYDEGALNNIGAKLMLLDYFFDKKILDYYKESSVQFFRKELWAWRFETENFNRKVKFSPDAANGVFDAYTVTYIMLQFAVYMGFDEIILLGCDHNYSKTIDNKRKVTILSGADSFIKGKDIEKEGFSLPNLERNAQGFECAERFAKKHGIKILNATRGGKLEVFKRVDFDTLFN